MVQTPLVIGFLMNGLSRNSDEKSTSRVVIRLLSRSHFTSYPPFLKLGVINIIKKLKPQIIALFHGVRFLISRQFVINNSRPLIKVRVVQNYVLAHGLVGSSFRAGSSSQSSRIIYQCCFQLCLLVLFISSLSYYVYLSVLCTVSQFVEVDGHKRRKPSHTKLKVY